MSGHLFTFGHGYSAAAITRALRAQGWRVTGTTRDAAGAARIAASGATPLIWPGDPAAVAAALDSADHLLISTGPDQGGDPVLADTAAREVIRRVAPRLRWAGYLSSTNVYGDHQGAWVDEGTALSPSTGRGRARVEAEGDWQAFAADCGLPLHLFRLAGIYGPGRGPFAKVRAGTARRIIKPGQIFSRIHVDDIAAVVLASIARPDPGAVYNVCDDEPAPPEDVIEAAARMLNLPIPPAEDYATAEQSPMARSFYAESKRVRNERIKADLGVVLAYPDYRAGLAAVLAAEDQA
ncbi:SDR family oxidoreductase [Paracoccus sp. p4-l81]|uniref:SDR family oxidoreductase n=1 Tax=Paracoccus sp. p4-l81 TaxID=3342806 RepID=UPI0035B8284A